MMGVAKVNALQTTLLAPEFFVNLAQRFEEDFIVPRRPALGCRGLSSDLSPPCKLMTDTISLGPQEAAETFQDLRLGPTGPEGRATQVFWLCLNIERPEERTQAGQHQSQLRLLVIHVARLVVGFEVVQVRLDLCAPVLRRRTYLRQEHSSSKEARRGLDRRLQPKDCKRPPGTFNCQKSQRDTAGHDPVSHDFGIAGYRSSPNCPRGTRDSIP